MLGLGGKMEKRLIVADFGVFERSYSITISVLSTGFQPGITV